MKNSFTQTLYKNRATLCALLIMLCGVLVRVVNFGTTPTGFNQDEAFAGYEAFSLLHYGVDSWGYHNPCYFVSWGSGMNVLQSYLAIPFIKLLGCSITAVRLPQLLLACLSLPVFYLLMKNVFSTRAALTGLFLLAISPWHIMLSRWGLESNLAPAFLLLGLYFFIKGIENNRYWLASGVMYGLSLYAYSITWLVVPVTIVLWVLYLLLSKQKFSFTYLLLFGAILFVFALPQMFFLLVNKGFISEIVTPFISIPKLTVMRGAEISLKNLFSPDTYKNFIDVFIRQNDGLPWNATESFGLFYKISLPFIALGAIKLLKTTWISAKSKTFCHETIIILGMLSSIFTCLLLSNLNVNKANCLHFYTLILLTVGVLEFFALCKGFTCVKITVFCAYLLSFACFVSFYFNDYDEQISYSFNAGLQPAVSYAKEQTEGDIWVDTLAFYPQILFFDQTPTPSFLSTVKYFNYPSAFLVAQEFTRYHFGIDYNNIPPHGTYIIPKNMLPLWEGKGYKTATFHSFAVATRAQTQV